MELPLTRTTALDPAVGALRFKRDRYGDILWQHLKADFEAQQRRSTSMLESDPAMWG